MGNHARSFRGIKMEYVIETEWGTKNFGTMSEAMTYIETCILNEVPFKLKYRDLY